MTDRLASIILAHYYYNLRDFYLSMLILDGLQYVNCLIGQLLARKCACMYVNRPLSHHEQERAIARVANYDLRVCGK